MKKAANSVKSSIDKGFFVIRRDHRRKTSANVASAVNVQPQAMVMTAIFGAVVEFGKNMVRCSDRDYSMNAGKIA